jgi:hypothetical protein
LAALDGCEVPRGLEQQSPGDGGWNQVEQRCSDLLDMVDERFDLEQVFHRKGECMLHILVRSARQFNNE